MTCREAGKKGGQASGKARLLKGREQLMKCTTYAEVLKVVQDLEHRAYQKGWHAGRRSAPTSAGMLRG